MSTKQPANSVNKGISPCPVLFLQIGSNTRSFLKKVFEQAELTNGKHNVKVLTNTDLQLYQDHNCIDITSYLSATAAFTKVYKHHSSNSYEFEKACFDRWFIINELADQLNADHFFYADCDVLLMADLEPVHRSIVQKGYAGAMMSIDVEGSSITSAHSSFWSRDLLGKFCQFVYDLYADPVAFEQLVADVSQGKYYENSNISDMVLLDLFRKKSGEPIFNLLLLEDEQISFDLNINLANNGYKYRYAMNTLFNIKKVIKTNSEAYGSIEAGGEIPPIKFYTLHFQGNLSKALIPMYVNASSAFGSFTNTLLSLGNYLNRKKKLLKARLKSKK